MRVGVIGGGLAGLVTAFDLVSAGAEVTLFEEARTLGGQIRTRRDAGFVVEDGAEGWVAADTDVPQLCSALGIENELVQQLERRSLFLSRGKLTDLKSGDAARLLGIQASDSDLGRGIASLRSGMGVLTDSLARLIHRRATFRFGEPITLLAGVDNAWRVTNHQGENEQVDAVVAAVPAPALAAMASSLAPAAAEALRRIEFASNVSVSIGYEAAAVAHPLDASGFVVDKVESLEGLRACAFSSSKLPNRAAKGRVLVRAFFRPDASTQLDGDEIWRDRAVRLLEPILQISKPPIGAWVARWPEALPQYLPKHDDIIATSSQQLQAIGPFQLAGTSYHPSGIPGAVRSGRAAARLTLAG